MVEFAIVAPLLFLFFFAVIDFGRALFLYNNLQDTARRGARLGAVQTQTPNPCGSAPTVRDSVRGWVQEFNNNPLPKDSINVDMRCVDATGAVTSTDVSSVIVTISNYPFRPITPLPRFAANALSGLQITRSAGARFEGASTGP